MHTKVYCSQVCLSILVVIWTLDRTFRNEGYNTTNFRLLPGLETIDELHIPNFVSLFACCNPLYTCSGFLYSVKNAKHTIHDNQMSIFSWYSLSDIVLFQNIQEPIINDTIGFSIALIFNIMIPLMCVAHHSKVLPLSRAADQR